VPLKIAGDGPLADELAGLGGPVELLGRLDQDELDALLRGAAMAVVPSVGGDVMPFAALEAMAAGLPVIAADSGSLPEVVGPEHCVPRHDPHALAEATSALQADPNRRRIEGDANMAHARERFGESRYAEGLRALYAGTHAHA
jgi:glycosyltransferase involved in cell wall biosynthesis